MKYNKKLYEKYGFKVTDDPLISSSDKSVLAKAERFHKIVTTNRSTALTVQELKQAISLNPEETSFKNYLYAALTQTGKKNEAYEVLHDTVKKHPDYIFGHINMARHYMNNNEFDKATSILGASYDITQIEKGEYIHFSAFKGYYSAAIELELKKKNIKKAEELHRMIFDYDKNDAVTKTLAKLIVASRFLDNPLFVKASNERNVEVISKPIIGNYLSDAEGKPIFNHSEIHQLYQYSLKKIPKATIKSILALPRTTLVQDLEHVIMDAVLRYDYYQELEWNEDTQSFFVHAIYLLTELKSYDSLPVILDFLRQDEDFREYWVADWLETYFEAPLYILGENQLEILKGFVLEENLSSWNRNIICDVVAQVAIKQAERRQEVILWFKDVIYYHLDNADNENLIDSDFISSLISTCTDFKGIELEADIELLYAQGWVNKGYCGNLEAVLTDLKKPFNPFDDKPLPRDLDDLYSSDYEKRRNKSNAPIDSNLLERLNDPYRDYLMNITTQQLINSKYDDDDYDWTPQLPVKREEPKVGRNDPCPCGSGKKYKKCCGK